MQSAKVSEALAQVASSQNPETMLEAIIFNIKNLSSPTTIAADLTAIADAIIVLPYGIVAKRTVLDKFISTLRSFENYDVWVEVGQNILSFIASNTTASSSLLDQAAAVRELIATGHEGNEDFADAAKVLSEIPLDSSQRRVSDAEKVKIWIRIVRNYLEVDDSTAAESYLNKLKNVMHTIDDPELNLHFKLSAARIQDSKRQFLAAAQSYHDISVSPVIAEEERLHTLSMAIKCAILAPAGPDRRKVLGRLYKDDRAAGLEEFGILEKMFLDRLLAPAEVDKFAQGLQPHQLARTSDGSTVLVKAVVEHNLLGASRLYSNIGFDELALLLGLGRNADKAEDTTARMIEQGRLAGRIDQIDRIIWFEGGETSREKGSGHAELTVGKEMRRWDANVQALAEELEQLTNSLQAEFPVFVERQLAA
ncbi:putative cop9 signalosome complex subunit 4 protein [Phialemonium atrogriseum]|uniref:COP9 signalosome complex subunit 4 n=1 Tax=Phialemonium atrogriseum TaxID=1093897 RepID=A0AAJ0BXT4_9PEZI|nr:putative cop9 signalosome complex subunit 4 protein [Phialemonium atrogriseum]KAK1765363.1 putative cop9 signalosome complex subunit 4 protein [Phialemonium atrogriseum]